MGNVFEKYHKEMGCDNVALIHGGLFGHGIDQGC